MGTRSAIAMKTEDGIRSIYCHWDGYVDHNGRILKEFYSTDEKVKALLDLGDLSSLRQEIGEAHDFDRHYAEPNLEGWTLPGMLAWFIGTIGLIADIRRVTKRG